MTQHLLSLASFFTIEAREYANFTFDAAARNTLRNVILAFCIGILLASLYTLYQKLVPGNIVRKLLGAQAHTPETAKTLAELSLDRNRLVAYELSHNRVLAGLIKTVEGEGDTRYYIPEELKYRADVRFEEKGFGVAALLLTAVVVAGLALALIAFFPVFLSIIDNLM